MQITLIFTLDGLLFEVLVAFGHLDGSSIETAVKSSDVAFRNSITRASSLLLLHGIMSLYARLFSASTVPRTALSLGRVVLLDFHTAAHGRIRNLSWIGAQVFALGIIEYNLTISCVEVT